MKLMYTGTVVDGSTGEIVVNETMDLLKGMTLWQRIGTHILTKLSFERWFNTILEKANLHFEYGTMQLLWTKFYEDDNGNRIGMASLKIREFARPLAWGTLNVIIEQK